jgi:hypothetical protein
MLLSGALLALLVTGCWLYCLTDVILTPAPECRGLPKRAWIAVIAVTFIGGALAWLVVRRPVRDSSEPMPRWDLDQEMVTGPQAPHGPDDDLEFLRALDRAIHGNRQADPEA